MTITDPEVERFVNGPAPYSSGNAVPTSRPRYKSAEQELADALEGQAPRLAHTVAEKLSPSQTAELAQVIRRAVAVGIRRRAEQETAERVAGMYDLLVDGLNRITECTTSEDEQPAASCDHSESLYGRCVSCGMTWEQQAAEREGLWTCGSPNPSDTTGCAREEGHDGDHQAADGETWAQQVEARRGEG